MGCSNCNKNEGSFSGEGLEVTSLEATTNPYAVNQGSAKNCQSNKGKFFDTILEDFTVPQVGGEGYLKVCDGKLWKAGMFIGVNYSSIKHASFKITQVGTQKLKVLNGCDKSGANPIVGNPEVGDTIPEGAIIYPIPPTGCSDRMAERLLQVLQSDGGINAVLELLDESDEISFSNTPEVADDEEVHLFGGLKPDCDCAPTGTRTSWLRKIINIFTGQAGNTLCMPNVAQTDFDEATDPPKRLAVFDANRCLKLGPTSAELKNCDSKTPLPADDRYFGSISACKDGVNIGVPAHAKHLELTTTEIDDPESDDPDDKILVWTPREKMYALLQHTTGAGVAGGASTTGAWNTRPITSIVKQNPSDLVSLASNIITINKPGLFEIEFAGTLFAASDAQLRLENVDDPTEVFYSNDGYTTNDAYCVGVGIIEVVTTKRFKISYRVQTANANGLGQPNSWGPNVYMNVKVRAI